MGNEFVNKGQNKEQVVNAVGALSKAIFSRCFYWLVQIVNETLDVKNVKRAHFIGVLDIAGFETFEVSLFKYYFVCDKNMNQFNYKSTMALNNCALITQTNDCSSFSTISCLSLSRRSTKRKESSGK